jgi:Spy/CpxP family protein refolding chaperone
MRVRSSDAPSCGFPCPVGHADAQLHDRNRHQGKDMKKYVAAVLFGAAMIAAQSTVAEDKSADVTDMQALRKAVQSDKKAFVASTLKLTDAEAKRFWPLYDAYQRDVDLANRRRNVVVVTLIGRDKPLSDLYARNLATELMAADEAEVKSRRTLQNRLMRGVPTRILPPRKAARYLQLESKIRAVQAYDIAATIPLID